MDMLDLRIWDQEDKTKVPAVKLHSVLDTSNCQNLGKQGLLALRTGYGEGYGCIT